MRMVNCVGNMARAHYLEPKTGIVIPMQAVNRVGGQSFVYVVEEDKSKENRNLWCIKTCEITCAERSLSRS